ncbi:MFS domain-containing protein [Pseudoscourfieldia marina]
MADSMPTLADESVAVHFPNSSQAEDEQKASAGSETANSLSAPRDESAARPSAAEEPKVLVPRSQKLTLFFLAAGKTLTATTLRMLFPFAPELGRAVNVSLEAIALVITGHEVAYLLASSLTAFPLKAGYSNLTVCSVALAFAATGLLLIVALPRHIAVLAMGVPLLGVGKGISDVAIQGYITTNVFAEVQGTVTGAVEVSWGMASFVGLPIAGVLFAVAYRAPFACFAACQAVLCVCLALRRGGASTKHDVQTATPTTQQDSEEEPVVSWRALLLSKRGALGLIIPTFFLIAAAHIFFMLIGVWLEETHHMSTTEIGTTSLVVGVADVLGELTVARLGDRMGAHRLRNASYLCAVCLFFLFGLMCQAPLGLSLGAWFLCVLSFEVAFVSSLAMSSKEWPNSNGRAESAVFFAVGAGTIAGSLAGAPLWDLHPRLPGLHTAGLVAGGMTTIGCVCAFVGTRPPPPPPSSSK